MFLSQSIFYLLGVFVRIAEGIYQIEGINGNVYLVEDGKKLILIDTGLPRSGNKIIKYLEKLGRKPRMSPLLC